MLNTFISKKPQVNFGFSFFYSFLMWMVLYSSYGGYPWIGFLLEGGLGLGNIGLWILLHLSTWGIFAFNLALITDH